MRHMRRFAIIVALSAIALVVLAKVSTLGHAAATEAAVTSLESAPASDWNISGSIQQMNGQFWSIQGFSIMVNNDTRVTGGVPTIGAFADAEGIVEPGGGWLATRITVHGNDDQTPTPVVSTTPTATVTPAGTTPDSPTATSTVVGTVSETPTATATATTVPAATQTATSTAAATQTATSTVTATATQVRDPDDNKDNGDQDNQGDENNDGDDRSPKPPAVHHPKSTDNGNHFGNGNGRGHSQGQGNGQEKKGGHDN
jgi:hypothetical protein